MRTNDLRGAVGSMFILDLNFRVLSATTAFRCRGGGVDVDASSSAVKAAVKDKTPQISLERFLFLRGILKDDKDFDKAISILNEWLS